MCDYVDWDIYSDRDIDRYIGLNRVGPAKVGCIEADTELHRDNQGKRCFEKDPNASQSKGKVYLGAGNVAEAMIDWDAIMSRLGIGKECNNLTREDLVGKQFVSDVEAERFFNVYARKMGFGVRKGSKRRKGNGDAKIRSWMCSAEGYRQEKFVNKLDRQREAKVVTRCGCLVVFRINKMKTGQWLVKEFITNHSHNLVPQVYVQYMRSHRHLTEATVQLAKSMKNAGVRTCKIMSYLALQSGGYEKLPFLISDLYNRLNRESEIELADSDAAKAIGYLDQKASTDRGFFAKYTYDADLRLKNLIWADGRCRSDYLHFGDVLAFDSTYRTNEYGKPLVIMVGVNHHFKTTILAYAIIPNETVSTYKWVIESFLECMNGKHPKTVITDSDPSMRRAIKELMPNTVHRLCGWHIRKNAASRVHDPCFLNRLNQLMVRYYSEPKFEEEWKKLITDYAVEGNHWLNWLYDSRHMWAEAFLRGRFFANMHTTQRCEGMNSFIKTKVTQKIKLTVFVRLLDMALSWKRHTENQMDFESNNTMPSLGQTHMPQLEKQAANTFTREIFVKIRAEIKKEGKYMVRRQEDCDANLVRRVLCKYTDGRWERKVTYLKKTGHFECDCNWFPTMGLPCRHIFAMMKSLHITELPSSLILSRWMKTTKASRGQGEISCQCSYYTGNEEGRYGEMSRHCNELAYMASKSEKAFQAGTELVSMAKERLGQICNDNVGSTGERSTTRKPSLNIKNPASTRTKGTAGLAPKGSGGLRRCSECKMRGHNKATCKQNKRRVQRDNSEHPWYDEVVEKDATVDLGDDNDFYQSFEDHIAPFPASSLKTTTTSIDGKAGWQRTTHGITTKTEDTDGPTSESTVRDRVMGTTSGQKTTAKPGQSGIYTGSRDRISSHGMTTKPTSDFELHPIRVEEDEPMYDEEIDVDTMYWWGTPYGA